MANAYVNLPVPAGDGVGAWVNCAGLAPGKAVAVDGGAFAGTLFLEASNDAQASSIPLPVGPFADPTSAPVVFTDPTQFMRVRRTGSTGGPLGAPLVNMGAAAVTGNLFGALAVPASDGVGAALDLTAGGDLNLFSIAGAFTGSIIVETSEDGVNFSPALLFSVAGSQNVAGVLNSARIRRRGVTGGAAPLASVGSGFAGGGGGGVPSSGFKAKLVDASVFGPFPFDCAFAGAAVGDVVECATDMTAVIDPTPLFVSPVIAPNLVRQTAGFPGANVKVQIILRPGP